MSLHLHRSSATPLGSAVGGTDAHRGWRAILHAASANQPEFSRTAFRVLLVLAVLLLADCYMLRMWLDVPLSEATIAAVPSSLDVGLGGAMFMTPGDEPVTPIDSDAVVKGLSFGLGLLAAVGSSVVFFADLTLRGGALLHRLAVRRAVRRLTTGNKRSR